MTATPAVWGAKPWITDTGTDWRPIRWPASRLTDHVSAAVTAMPSIARIP
jgi:hypothetical protein